jgi:hypothetical protein
LKTGTSRSAALFAQWLARPGAPEIEIVSAQRGLRGEYTNRTELRQGATPYQLNAPLRVYLEGGAIFDAEVALRAESQTVTLPVPNRALSVAIDPEVRLFRRLDRAEIAPILRQVLLDRRTALVQATSDPTTQEAATALAAATLEHVPPLWQGASISASVPLLVIGLHTDVERFLALHALPPVPNQVQGRGTAFVYAGRTTDGIAYAVVSARDAAALAGLVRSLPHLGAQSFVVFEGARSTERGLWPTEAPRYAVTD